jgi:hypothetical protein
MQHLDAAGNNLGVDHLLGDLVGVGNLLGTVGVAKDQVLEGLRRQLAQVADLRCGISRSRQDIRSRRLLRECGGKRAEDRRRHEGWRHRSGVWTKEIVGGRVGSNRSFALISTGDAHAEEHLAEVVARVAGGHLVCLWISIYSWRRLAEEQLT